GSFSNEHRRSLQHLLLLLSLLGRLLGLERLLIRVELRLGPDKDLVLGPSGKHVIDFPLVFYRRDSVHSQLAYLLLLLASSDRLGLKPCLSQQALFLSDRGLVGAGGLACCH